MNWKLVREQDGLTKQSKEILWVEWNQDGTYKQSYEELGIGRSLIMFPFNPNFEWLTTEVTQIIEQKDNYAKFKTKNSTYELFKL